MEGFSVDLVAYLHGLILKDFGGLPGIRDRGQLESVLEHIGNDRYYPTVVEKAAHLFCSIIQFHCFVDGNKRTAIYSTGFFLERSGVDISGFIVKLEDVAVGVAKNELGKDDVKKIFRSMFESFGYDPDMALAPRVA